MNLAAAPPSAEVQNDVDVYDESDPDMESEAASEKSSDDELESMISDDDTNDGDFMDVEGPVTPKSKPCKVVTPKAPEKQDPMVRDDIVVAMKEDLKMGDNVVVAVKARS